MLYRAEIKRRTRAVLCCESALCCASHEMCEQTTFSASQEIIKVSGCSIYALALCLTPAYQHQLAKQLTK